MLKRLEQAGVVKADGVISLDPVALSYLLEVTGPVELDGLPEPLTQSNMVEWALNRHYFYFASDNTERREQLAEVGDAVWTRLLSGEGIDPKAFAEALGRGLSERRVVIYSYDPGEQALIERLGIGGGLSDEEGDYLLLVGQNLGENKMDYYLDRSMTYSGEIDGAGTLRADLKIDIENTAPQGVEFPGHVGSPRPHLGLEAGFARSYLEVFVPRRAVLQQVRIDGKPSKNFEVRDELGKSVYITTVTLGPGQSQRIEFSYVVRDAVVDGVYRLNLQNQAMIRPDQLAIDVAIPEGIEIGARDGFGHGPRLSWEGELVSDTELSAELDVPWHVWLASKVSSWLNKPAIEIGKR